VRWQQASQVTLLHGCFPPSTLSIGESSESHIYQVNRTYITIALLENPTYILRLFFHLYKVFLALVQITTFVPVGGAARYKCSLSSQGRVGASSNPPGTNASHLYRVVAPTDTNVRMTHLYWVAIRPGTNVVTFISRHETPWYKCSHTITAPPFSLQLSCNPCIYVDKFIYLSLSILISFLFSPIPISFFVSSLSISLLSLDLHDGSSRGGAWPGPAACGSGVAWRRVRGVAQWRRREMRSTCTGCC
jgi:hypothetical protein